MTVLTYLLGFMLVSVVSSVLIGTALGRSSTPAPPSPELSHDVRPSRTLWLPGGTQLPKSAATGGGAVPVRRLVARSTHLAGHSAR